MNLFRPVMLASLCLGLLPGMVPARAQIPQTIPFQGRLTKSDGTSQPDGGYFATFRLYDRETGGAPLWEETKTVAMTRGPFSTTLGSATPFPPSLLFDKPYFLGVQMPGDSEMTPRLPLGAVPYALRSGGVLDAGAAAGSSPLAGLSRSKPGRARQQGSRDPTGGNFDLRPLEPGQTITLFNAQGAGIIQRFWCTIAPRADMELHRQAILRMYWDGEATPSVEVPIGDFFGVGFGQQVDYQSMPLNETSGGYNCYWEMPFHTSARWTLTNMSAKRLDAFYFNIDYTEVPSLPADRYHFHAQWRRENPTTEGRNYTILDAAGKGHYVGTALFMQNRRGTGLGFLEGDEMIFIDGEASPSIYGTGTEDYFSSGWYYDRGPYSALYHGIPIKDTGLGRISTYRWHIEDAKPFQSSIRVTIEHGHANDHVADYSSVAYWYQTEPHAAFPAFPTNPDLLLPYTPPPPYVIPNAIEGESLVATSQATSGTVTDQEMSMFGDGWSRNSQLWWRPNEAGAVLTLKIPAPSAGSYALTGYFTRARDYGTIQIRRNGQAVGPVVNLYDPNVVPTGAIALGTVNLAAGDNTITVHVTGKDPLSTDYMVGIDAFVLTPQ